MALFNSLLSFCLDVFKGCTVHGGCHLYCTAQGAALQCHLRCPWQGLGLFTLSLVSSPLKHPFLYASIFASSFSSLTLTRIVLWSITRINLLERNFDSSAFRKWTFFLEEGFSQHLVYVPNLTVILKKGNQITGCKTIWSRAEMYWEIFM